MDFMDEAGLATLLQHFAEEEKPHGAVVPPLYQNSLFVFDDCESFLIAHQQKPEGPPHHYSRLSNPTVEIIERKIAMLEGCEAAKAFGTGMAAISAAVMSCAEGGAHFVVVDTCYNVVKRLIDGYLSRFGVSATYVDGTCHEEIIDSIRPETKGIYLESPTSVFFKLQDLERIGKAAREKGVTTMIDNTYSTPLYQQPAKYGIDIVLHSASKYLGGHSDILGGMVCGSRERINKMVREEIYLIGGIMSPFTAWLLNRGMRTLALRLKAHEESANQVAAWLEDREEVEKVFHVGLPSHPQWPLFRKQMSGSAGLFSFEPKNQDPEWTRRFVDALQLFKIAVSWGGFESLVVPLHMSCRQEAEPRYVIRLFCGLEDVPDMIADLDRAFAAANV
jgi:cystathionine beta-lyase